MSSNRPIKILRKYGRNWPLVSSIYQQICLVMVSEEVVEAKTPNVLLATYRVV
jgi:hypothetical protein